MGKFLDVLVIEKTEGSLMNILDFGAIPDGETLATKEIQAAIDAAQGADKQVVIPKGKYLVGSLFLKEGTHLYFEKGATLIGSTDLKDYPLIDTRVAGVEMKWPAAILNVLDTEEVLIDGPGQINGNGSFWWNLYWGPDGKSGQRKIYDAKNLRWIVDYAVQRPREILVYKSRSIKISDLNLTYSGFWNLQITYCQQIEINNIMVNHSNGPSTDGIDVDSSHHVRIHDCELSCGDDCIALKSGRDGDGKRVGLATHDVEIDHCTILSGYGVTIGSEVSGNVYGIRIHDMLFHNTGCGIRMKSSEERGGTIEDVIAENLKMENVQFPFSWLLNWHRAYNTKDFTSSNYVDFPDYWKAVAAEIPEIEQKTKVRNIHIKNVVVSLTADYAGSSRAFDLKAFIEKPMEDIHFENVSLSANEFGNIIAVDDLKFDNVEISVQHDNFSQNDSYDNR